MSWAVAEPGDIDSVSACIASAFATDPIWSVALSRADGATDHHEPYWRNVVEGAMRFGTVHRWESGAAVSVWVPPGESELTPELEQASEALLVQYLDANSIDAMHELYERFETSRGSVPQHHAYLALLATHREHRGRGVGQALLAADLLEWDSLGVPAYLESSNPANDHRYARAGFEPIGGFEAVRNNARVTAMWRSVPGEPQRGEKGESKS
jgi:GNAT superfamily N-acetyltransferase